MALQPIGLDATIEHVPDFTGGIDKMNRAVDSFASNSSKQGGMFSGGFGEIVTGALRQVGELAVQALLKAGQAIAGFVKDSIGLAGDFEANMLQFQSVAGKGVDTKGLEQFRDLFLDIGKRLPVSTSEVQQAAIEMVKGGIDPATIAAGGLEQNIQFAAAAMGGDLVKAAEISSKILGGWAGVGATAAEKADFLTHATDLLAKAANASSTDVEGLSRGIFQAQGIARTAGVSFDDLTTTLAELAPRFASSAEAGTSLKNMIVRMQPTTKPAISAMKDLGLYTDAAGSAFYDAQGNFVGFEQASQLLQNSLQGLTKEQQASALQTIFGNDAMGSAAGLAELGAQGYQDMAAALANANGVQAAAALKQQGFNTALDNAKGSVEALQITIGTALLPVLTTLLNDTIAPAVNTITSFAEAFMKMVPAIEASDDPFRTFMLAVAVAAPGLTDLVFQILRFTDSLKPAIAEFSRLIDAFSAGGISGLIDTLTTDISAALPDIEAALLSWGQAFVDWIAPMIPPALDALADLADQAWAWVKEQAPGWGKQLAAWGNELVDWIAPMIPPALAELGKLGTDLLQWIGDQAAPLLAKLQAWATSLVAWIVPATVTFLAEWPKMFDQFLDWVGNAAGPLLKQLGDWAISFIGWIAPMIPPFLVALGGVALAIGVWVIETAAVLSKKIIEVWVPALLTWIVTDAIPGLVKALNSFLQVIDGWIKGAEKSVGEWMRTVGVSTVLGLEKGINDAWGGLLSWFNDKVKGLVDAALDAIGAGSPAKEFMPVGEYALQGIMSGIEGTLPALTDLINQTGTTMINALKKNIQKGGDEIRKMMDDLTAEVKDISSQINDAIADGFGATASIDRQIAKNLEKFKDIPDQYRQYTEGALKQAQMDAAEFADPTQGARFFKMRSDQILEYAKLQQDLAEQQDALNAAFSTENDPNATQDQQAAALQSQRAAEAMIAMLQQQMILINAAQTQEIRQWDANQSGQTTPMQDIAAQIQALFNSNAVSGQLPGILENQIIAQLTSLMQQLQSPPGVTRTPYNPGATNTTNTTNFSMPIYTNMSPNAIQDSMAIAGAALL